MRIAEQKLVPVPWCGMWRVDWAHGLPRYDEFETEAEALQAIKDRVVYIAFQTRHRPEIIHDFH